MKDWSVEECPHSDIMHLFLYWIHQMGVRIQYCCNSKLCKAWRCSGIRSLCRTGSLKTVASELAKCNFRCSVSTGGQMGSGW